MPAELRIGTLHGTENPAVLRAPRLNRHTFWCGQSGSGKTYALGVLLEQVLLRTRLPIVVLNPNSDFVCLGETNDDAPADAVAGLNARDIRVLRTTGEGERLLVSFVDRFASCQDVRMGFTRASRKMSGWSNPAA